jgi:aminoglycoside phosphotransferase family enzyme
MKQPEIISLLLREDAYNHKVPKIRVEETHISWVILTGMYAYKVKKELKFGKVLDFSKLQLRRKACQKEVMLNKILCSDMYKGVVKVVRSDNTNNNHSNNNKDVKLQFVDLNHRNKAIEYAVKMKEIPQKFRMDNLVAANKVGLRTIEKLTYTLAKFHHATPTNTIIKRFGQPRFMKAKVLENFETLHKLYDDYGYDHNSINDISKLGRKLISFIENNKQLFHQRIAENKIRDIHGDLYMKNIFIVQQNNKFYLYDRIEFNDSLRYADVVEDVAHICMDLDYQKRSHLKRYFLSSYIEETKDFQLNSMVYFLMCYKACMRAKVCFFKGVNERGRNEKITCLRESNSHLRLAKSYLEFL